MVKIDELTENEQAWLVEQLHGAELFVEAYAPGEGQGLPSLEALDRAWTAWMAAGETDGTVINGAVNAVGAAFGQWLSEGGVLRWVIATDEHGSDLAVYGLPGRGDILVYPANFVAKRYERRETGFLARSYQQITEQVEAGQRAHEEPQKSWWKRFTGG